MVILVLSASVLDFTSQICFCCSTSFTIFLLYVILVLLLLVFVSKFSTALHSCQAIFFLRLRAPISSFLDNHNFGTNCFAFHFSIYNLLYHFMVYPKKTICLMFQGKTCTSQEKTSNIFVLMFMVFVRYLFVTIVLESYLRYHIKFIILLFIVCLFCVGKTLPPTNVL